MSARQNTGFVSSFVARPLLRSLRPSASPVRVARASLQARAPAAAMSTHTDIKRLAPGARFNQVVVHGGVAYLAGQVARGTDGSVGAQTAAILQKIDGLLADAGTDKSRVLSATIWLADVAHVAEMNAAWDAWVDRDNMPVRACVQSALVADDITVEVQVTAALPSAARVIETDAAAAAVGPYNQGVVVRDGTVYVSGCIGLMPGSGAMAGDDVESQTAQALANMRAILAAAGAAPADVVKTTVLLDDIADFAKVNKLYEAFFAGDAAPARSCFAAKQLPKGALVEIEATATLPL